MLCKRHGVDPRFLGKNAGTSLDAVPGLIDAARKGEAQPGRAKTYWLLSRLYGVTMSWFFETSDLPEDSWK
jgi:hypothetical protein